MIYYDRIDVSKIINVNKTSVSKECDICWYWYFLDDGIKLQSDSCNECHDVLMIFVSPNDIGILNIYGVDYCCIINRISKSEAVKLLQNAA